MWRMVLWVTLPVIVIDQITKWYIETRFELFEAVSVIPDLLAIVSVRNQGAAFSILANSSIRKPFFIVVSTLACLVILWYLRRHSSDSPSMRLPLALILGGAAGNLIDRIRLGEVIDFIDVYWKGHHWPAFNIADSAICIGVALLSFRLWKEQAHAAAGDGDLHDKQS
ncbi:MAG: signal peptidase II [Deltaproteobacteria bacterium]|nr:signal peptidase II [Deltaproteobacteria bacterium]